MARWGITLATIIRALPPNRSGGAIQTVSPGWRSGSPGIIWSTLWMSAPKRFSSQV
jgi:hypothetical protein